MLMEKKHRVVLVTGGAQRIGKSIALHLASRGFKIAVHYNRSKTDAEKAVKEIRGRKGICEIFSADLEDPEQVKNLVPQVLQKFFRCDVLINNASIFERSNIRTGSIEMLERHWAINLRAPYILMKEFVQRCKRGQVINVLDTHVVKNRVSHAAYLLSKKSLADLTKMAAVELAPQVRVNGIAPGLILPPVGKQNDYMKRLAQAVPLGIKGDLDKITQTVDFLIENTYLTGQIIFVDGGEHLI